MNEIFPLTATQRSAAVERIDENIVLLSGAGCGKTCVLGRRFTELLLKNPDLDNPLSRFVALTFTEKAAVEMQDRIRRLLRALVSQSKGEDRIRLLSWLSELPDARISTIHGFCASLLRSHAIDAAIDPNFTVCSDPLIADQMRNEAIERAILQGVEGPNRDVAELLGRVRYERVADQVSQLIETRTAWKPEEYRDTDSMIRRWKRMFEQDRQAGWKSFADDETFRRELEQLESLYCAEPQDKLELFRREQIELIRKIMDEASSRTPEAFSKLQSKPGTIGSWKNWGSKEQVREVRNRLKVLIARTADMGIFTEQIGVLDEQAGKVLQTLVRLSVEANEIYTATKRRRGLLDFNDLLITTRNLLEANPDLLRALTGRIDQLLLDEAQDTDAFQVALLETLIFGEAGGESLAEGRLFLVGDPKQSIYRFRGAQVEVFEELCGRLGQGHHENLDRSFRSHDAAVTFINHLFAPMMGSKYTPIFADRQTVPPHSCVEILLCEGTDTRPIVDADSASGAQAALTAQRIVEMVHSRERLVWDPSREDWRPVEYGDIAVLFSRMTNTLEYERQLVLRGAPYYVMAGTGFFKQQEIFDILNALRVIDNPYDDIAFFGVLRSSMIGLDDNALCHVAESVAPPYLPNLIKLAQDKAEGTGRSILIERLSSEQTEALKFAVDLLGALHRQKDAMGIDAIIARLLEETGFEGMLLGGFHGRQRCGNIRRFTAQARSAGAGGVALCDFIRQVAQQVISESRYEQAAVRGEADNVVRLMTIHKAKGLEFPVVFIPDLNVRRRGFSDVLGNRIDWGLTYKLSSDEGQEDTTADTPLSYRLAKRREDLDQQAEDIRKFYVALTRAKDHLVFVGADWRLQDGRLKEHGSYLSKMDEVLGITNALDAGADTIAYGDGRYAAAVRRIKLSPLSAPGASSSIGEKLLHSAACGSDLAKSILNCASANVPDSLIGAISPQRGHVELAVTALSDFEYCPMLYRWRYELRIPRRTEPIAQGQPIGIAGPDAATLGTLYHRCMEQLDFANPQSARPLVQQVIDEMDLGDSVHADTIAAEFDEMLGKLHAAPLGAKLIAAKQTFRELDFMMMIGPGRLRGQIDLLYQDADGSWSVVDYKSDQVASKALPDRAKRYELQLMIYSIAADRYLGNCPQNVAIYFLRAGSTYSFPIDSDVLSKAQGRIEELISRLIIARRYRNFERKRSDHCSTCPYGTLCDTL